MEGGGVGGGEVHSRYVGMQYFTRGRGWGCMCLTGMWVCT